MVDVIDEDDSSFVRDMAAPSIARVMRFFSSLWDADSEDVIDEDEPSFVRDMAALSIGRVMRLFSSLWDAEGVCERDTVSVRLCDRSFVTDAEPVRPVCVALVRSSVGPFASLV